MAENRKRKFWGWGYEDQGPTPEQQKHMAERMAKRFGLDQLELMPPPKESDLNLRAPRVKPPSALEAICYDGYARARGAYVRQGIARYSAGVPSRLSKSNRRGCVSAR